MTQLHPRARSLFFSLTALAVATPAMAGDRESAANGTRLVAVCSTTQVADFTRQVVGDRWRVISILGPKQDPHMFQPTPQVTKNVSRADLCFDNGLHLEGGDWMRVVAEQSGKKIISCTHGITPLQLEIGGETESVPDPHAWFSPKNAAVYIRNILQAVASMDPDNKIEYEARATLYLDQLRTLDLWVQRQINRSFKLNGFIYFGNTHA
jgi:manganese/iron transport system substrate-binding protein